jgi:hypothetical protein
MCSAIFLFGIFFLASSLRSVVVPMPKLAPLSDKSLGAHAFCKPLSSIWQSRLVVLAITWQRQSSELLHF